MTKENKPIEVVFAPGAFDSFEGTQEELDAMIAEVQAMFEGKTKEEIESMSQPIDLEELAMDDSLSDKEFEQISSIMLDADTPRKLQ